MLPDRLRSFISSTSGKVALFLAVRCGCNRQHEVHISQQTLVVQEGKKRLLMLLKQLWGKRAKREKWDASLTWFRLRYLEAAGPTQCLNLLSRPEACGRIALYYQPGEPVSELYLGVPESQGRLLGQMAPDFNLSLKPKSTEVKIPPAGRLVPAPELPWNQPFVAHIIQECLFISLLAESGAKEGSYLPKPSSIKNRRCPSAWQLPQPAPAGLFSRQSWGSLSTEIPPNLHENTVTTQSWPVGWTRGGKLLHVPGNLNLYGRRESVASWLVDQVTHAVTVNPSRLVVIDGVGDLVPQLKRKTVITRLMGEKLTYIDIDSVSFTNGFNPLAPIPGETESVQLKRWQRWFAGMQVQHQGIQMLSQAYVDGVEDIPGLLKWLKQQERQELNTAVSSLRMALDRLIANRTLRERLEWPANPMEILPEGLLLFACKASDWSRQQILRSVLLSVMQLQDIRLILHGFIGDSLDEVGLLKLETAVLSNGPLLTNSTTVLTECHTQGVTRLVKRFFAGDSLWQENIELLHRGDAFVISNTSPVWISWHR